MFSPRIYHGIETVFCFLVVLASRSAWSQCVPGEQTEAALVVRSCESGLSCGSDHGTVLGEHGGGVCMAKGDPEDVTAFESLAGRFRSPRSCDRYRRQEPQTANFLGDQPRDLAMAKR